MSKKSGTSASSRSSSSSAKAIAKQLSEEKYEEVSEAFNLFDTEGSGQIHASDVEIALRALGVVLTDDVLELVRDAMLSASGTGGGGSKSLTFAASTNSSSSAAASKSIVTFDAFLGQTARLLDDKKYELEMRKAFRLLDTDGKGAISLKNLERVARELGEDYSQEDLQAMMEEADRDKDGLVNEDEFMHVMKKAQLY